MSESPPDTKLKRKKRNIMLLPKKSTKTKKQRNISPEQKKQIINGLRLIQIYKFNRMQQNNKFVK